MNTKICTSSYRSQKQEYHDKIKAIIEAELEEKVYSNVRAVPEHEYESPEEFLAIMKFYTEIALRNAKESIIKKIKKL